MRELWLVVLHLCGFSGTTERLDRDTCHTTHTLHTAYSWLQRKGTLSTSTAGSAFTAAQGHEEQKLSEKLTLALCVA